LDSDETKGSWNMLVNGFIFMSSVISQAWKLVLIISASRRGNYNSLRVCLDEVIEKF